MLTRDQIIAADDREFDTVDVPEWGGTVRLSSITGGQRDEYEAGLIDERGKDRRMNLRNARAKLLVLCIVDETGAPMFTREDIGRLSRKNAKPIDRLFDRCRELCGLTQEDVDRITEGFDETQDDEPVTD
jgi:hypothetical protein